MSSKCHQEHCCWLEGDLQQNPMGYHNVSNNEVFVVLNSVAHAVTILD